ncbi:MAG: PD40 domain-containing protein [Anaerolineae bacterium]|nr:PD40 domain-containing protein [Anaerolineae bacterium]
MVYKRLFIPLVLVSLFVLAALLPAAAVAQTGSSFPVPPGRLLAGDEDSLFTIHADGTDRVNLLEEADPNCWLRDAKWSPDSTQFIYTQICGGSSSTDWHAIPRTSQVWLYNLTTGDSREVAPNAGGYQDYAGAWHPNGEQVMIYSNREHDRYNLYLVDLVSGEATKYTDFETDMGRVSWDPTGRYLLYNRYIADFNLVQWEVRALDTVMGNETEVAVGLTPNFSPDGKWVSFATEETPADVFLMPADCIYASTPCDPATQAINVTQTPDIDEREPVWSPDQTQLVYLRDTDPDPANVTWDVIRQELRTGLSQNLTNTPFMEERHSAWEPVGNVAPVPVEQSLPVVVRVTSTARVNLREGPATASEIAGIASDGQVLFVQGVAAMPDGNWYLVTLPAEGTSAWLFATLAAPIIGDPTTTPDVTP